MTARFYGWSPGMINGMKFQTFLTYFQAMESIKSQESLNSLIIADYPHLKADSRKKIHKGYSKGANKMHPPKVMTADELDAYLKANL